MTTHNTILRGIYFRLAENMMVAPAGISVTLMGGTRNAYEIKMWPADGKTAFAYYYFADLPLSGAMRECAQLYERFARIKSDAVQDV